MLCGFGGEGGGGGALAPADPPGPGVSDPGALGGGGGANSRAQENVFGWAGWVAWGICILVYVCVYINIYICIPVSKLHTGSTPEVLFVPPRAGMLAIGGPPNMLIHFGPAPVAFSTNSWRALVYSIIGFVWPVAVQVNSNLCYYGLDVGPTWELQVDYSFFIFRSPAWLLAVS